MTIYEVKSHTVTSSRRKQEKKMTSDEELGPLVRLWGIRLDQLPPTTAKADELAPFLGSILREAIRLLDSAVPRASTPGPQDAKATAWKSKGRRRPAGSRAEVELLERTFSAAELARVSSSSSSLVVGHRPTERIRAETWIGRRSVHDDGDDGDGGSRDEAAGGLASWAEFRDGLKDRHAEAEATFTPSIAAHRRAAAWDCGGVEVEVAAGGAAGEEATTTTWGDFTLAVEEARHRIGRPLLRDRVFAVLQLTSAVASAPAGGGDEFVVVSIPIVDEAEGEREAGTVTGKGNGKGKEKEAGAEAEAEAEVARKLLPVLELARDGGVVVGAYVSVERVRRLGAGEAEAEAGKIEWVMATASDARGVLPARVQAMAVPSQIVKDVPWFLAWAAQQRPAPEAV
ncbi:hypothetical protein RB601_001042 [Gaeumannomyces tritici]